MIVEKRGCGQVDGYHAKSCEKVTSKNMFVGSKEQKKKDNNALFR